MLDAGCVTQAQQHRETKWYLEEILKLFSRSVVESLWRKINCSGKQPLPSQLVFMLAQFETFIIE